MATIRTYTTIEQSRKLAEILPLESADMYYAYYHNPISGASYYEEYPIFHMPMNKSKSLPCWSLAALLGVLSEIKPQVYTPILFPSEGKWILQFAEYGHGNVCEVTCDNPVDACVAMIEELHKLNLL